MAYTNYSTTVHAIDPCDQARGTLLLQHLSDVILPVDEGSKERSLEAYMEHRFSLDDDKNLIEWWTTMLKLQAQKAALGIADSIRSNALKDAESTIRSKIKGTTFAEFINVESIIKKHFESTLATLRSVKRGQQLSSNSTSTKMKRQKPKRTALLPNSFQTWRRRQTHRLER